MDITLRDKPEQIMRLTLYPAMLQLFGPRLSSTLSSSLSSVCAGTWSTPPSSSLSSTLLLLLAPVAYLIAVAVVFHKMQNPVENVRTNDVIVCTSTLLSAARSSTVVTLR